jgi:exodeoxyribonuclease-3
MNVATFNVNSIRTRLPIVIDWLTANKPDALCVQETKVQDKDFPVDEFTSTGYNVIYKGQKSYNGVAIFSKHKFTDIEYSFDDSLGDEARFIKAQINGITIINTYVPQGFEMDSEKYQHKLDWLKKLFAYFKENFTPTDKLIWLGDLNIAPTDKDVYDPIELAGCVCFNDQLTNIFNGFIEWGFVDLFRLHHKEGGNFSFWDYRQPNGFKRNLGWRLDHILGTKSLAEKCISCVIDTKPRLLEKPSDHTFVIAEF